MRSIINPRKKRVTNNFVFSLEMIANIITLISAGGAVSAVALGQLPWSLSALSFVLGGWSGMLLGRLLAQRLPAAILQRGFSIAIAGVGLLMVLQILTGEMS